MIFVAMLMLVIGFTALVKGADVFVDGAAALAGKFGIPQLVIGLTIVAMGTSLPEAAVSITAGLKGNAGITVGNIVGSNILNILIILGVTALITNVTIQKSTFKYEIPYMLFITAVLLVMGATGNEINFVEGIVLWVLFIAYLIYLYFLAKKGDAGEDDNQSFAQYPLWKCGLFIVLGAVLVVAGSNFVVNGATTIARFMVDTAENGAEAVEKVKNSKPCNYDLVLMDVQMPVMNGYEATKQIRALRDPALAGITILAMTANAFDEDKKKALECGMNGFLSKPIVIEELISTLQNNLVD